VKHSTRLRRVWPPDIYDEDDDEFDEGARVSAERAAEMPGGLTEVHGNFRT